MPHPLRLCLVLHNHQPIGNFDGVFEQAYQDSYLPFLDVFESYPDPLRFSLHTSGPLMEWFDERHPEYLDRLARLVSAGRIEIVGGVFYEAIMTMIPPRDRVGQISSYTRWLENRLGGTVRGMWMPERVWEQSLTADIVQAGIQYTVLDDFHFRNAGLNNEELHGYYVTEDDGRVLSVFPGSEPLRYYIPFDEPHKTVDYLRGIAERRPNSVVVFGDDGEKFGTWPDTKAHVYDRGWLRKFFDTLLREQEWLKTTTLADAVDHVSPIGKIYIPDGSYREMTEWALPTNQQHTYEDIVHDLEHDERWPRIKPFVRGGFWRNFKVKYPEANEMYARMMLVSRRVQQAQKEGTGGEAFQHAVRALYRGQCNCSYWHGAFGGIYLPHLRNAVYNQLIAADNLLDQATGKNSPFVEATVDDFNFDARQEVRLASDKLIAFIAPATGGMLYELDIRSICANLGATLTRRPEAYHRKVLRGVNPEGGNVASIHDRVVFKQEGLEKLLQYDPSPRKTLLDHFLPLDTNAEAISRGEVAELGDFVQGVYEAKIRRGKDKIQLQLVRTGHVEGREVQITKAVTMTEGSSRLEISYLLEKLPQDTPLHFAVEFNFSSLPSGADDRYFYRGDHEKLGQLGTILNLNDTKSLGLVDEWLGIDVSLTANQPTGFFAFPVQTVSQSEGGFELVHQSVCVQPHWHVRGDSSGKWAVTLQLDLDTSLAEQRANAIAKPAVVGV